MTNYITVPGNSVNAFDEIPSGIILHGTRSGQLYSREQEFQSTVNYVKSGAGGLGWNATVGPNAVALHIMPGLYGWNAREHSSRFLALEFAQAHLGDSISDTQVANAADWIVNFALARWPSMPLFMPEHWELPAGRRDGKTDVDPSHPGALAERLLAAVHWIQGEPIVKIPADYVTKFALPDDHSQEALQGLIDNLEGVIHSVQTQGCAGAQQKLDAIRELLNA